MNSDRISLQAISSIPFAVAVLAGVILCLFIDSKEAVLSVVVFVCLLIAISTLTFSRLKSYRIIALLLFFFSVGWFRADLQLGRDDRWNVYKYSAVNDSVKVTGRVVIDASGSRDQQRITVDQVLLESDEYSLQLDELRVRLFGDKELTGSLKSGDIVYAVGRLRSSSERSAKVYRFVNRNSREKRSRRFICRFGFLFHLPYRWLFASSNRRFLPALDYHVFDNNLSPDAASLCRALVLGDREDFGYRFTEQLRLTV